ncbi:hypothetical protein [Streptomyces sp. NBC_01012]|uniref:hypothetical protein n=1 Tax=Streptomyces sp. NBC_01012 TaxID=2903717 RepID=UPI00386E787A|nr:hypothetical protein OG623_35060 [Streptomyces sp. NBC_01012]
MRLSPPQARSLRRLPTVTVLAAALCTGMTLLSPAATAGPAAADPLVCESTAQASVEAPQPGDLDGTGFSGTGTITCTGTGGEPELQGTTRFSGTLPSPTGGITPVYRGRVDWSDGMVTTGTLTDFSTQVGEDGVLEFTVKGINDAGSTRFGGYAVAISGRAVHEAPDLNGEISSTQSGQVTYTS